MLEQTKRTIETMKRAGFKRSEFSARVERFPVKTEIGKVAYEYGVVDISLKVRFDPTLYDVQKLIDGGLEVTQYIGFSEDRCKTTFAIRYGYRGVFQVCDFTEKDQHGFQIFRTICRAQ